MLVSTLGFLSSVPGQTMGMAVFSDTLIEHLGLSRTELSTAYLFGTVGSALCLTRAGRWYDRYGARVMLVGSALGLETTLIMFLALFPMAQLSLIVAMAPGGLGVFDLSWLGLLSLLDVTGAENFAVAQRIYVTIINLFWGGFAILLALTLPPPTVIGELP